jgi:hypothetical protein
LVPESDRQSVTRRVLVFFTLIVFMSTVISPLAAFASDPVASPDASASASENLSPEPSPSETVPDPTPEATPAAQQSSPEPTPLPTPVAPDYSPSGPPDISSDQGDYAPGELVTLAGSNWQAGELVHILVNDDWGSTWSRPVDVVADGRGRITDQFNLPNWFVATYSVVATGQLSGQARTTFTDSSPAAASTSILEETCAAATTSFTSGANVCVHSSVTVSSTGNQAYRVQWFNPSNVKTFEDIHTLSGSGTFPFDDLHQATAIGTWTVKGCGSASCTGSNLLDTKTFTVTAGTTTSLTSSSNPSVYGSTITFAATVSAVSGPNPGTVGTVNFKADGTTIPGCGAVGLSASTAQCSTSTLNATASPHAIVAQYSGGAGFSGSANSPALSQVVTKKDLTIAGASGNDRVYDGTATATVSFGSATLAGLVPGDTVAINDSAYSAAFNNKNVGNAKPISVSGVALSGASAGNYTVSQPSGLTASVSARALTISATGINKAYDGTAAATITLSDDRVSGDVLAASYGTATFDSADIGTDKPVSVSGISITGTDAGNYTFNTTASTTANIAQLDVTGSFTAADKTYDGTTAATVLTTTVNGAIGSDDVDLAYADATFDTAAAGDGKTVTLNSVTLTGAHAGNYHLTSVNTTTANISKADPTCAITGYTGTYDGDAHGASGTCTGVADEPLAGLDLGASFSDVPGGTASWTFTDETGNYNDDLGTAAIEIAQRQITVTADAKTKVFGNPDPAFTWHLTWGSLVTGDSITGSLTRTNTPPASESVGSHPILQGTVTAGANYALAYVGANLTITAWTAAGTGFYAPVGTPNSIFVQAPGPPAAPSCVGSIWNSAKGGSTVPLKFNVYAGTVEKTSLTDIIGFTTSTVSCSGTPTYTDTIDFTTTGNTSLRYDGTAGQWIQNWKTPNVGQNAYYRVYVKFADGSTLSAFFLLKK